MDVVIEFTKVSLGVPMIAVAMETNVETYMINAVERIGLVLNVAKKDLVNIAILGTHNVYLINQPTEEKPVEELAVVVTNGNNVAVKTGKVATVAKKDHVFMLMIGIPNVKEEKIHIVQILDVVINGINVVGKIGKVLLVVKLEIVNILMNGILNVEMILTNVILLLQKNVVKNGTNAAVKAGLVQHVAKELLVVLRPMNGIHNVYLQHLNQTPDVVVNGINAVVNIGKVVNAAK